MKAVRTDDLQHFVDDMVTHLRAHFSDELGTLSDEALAERVDDGLARAAEYGLTSRRDGARYLGLAACFGWSFDTQMEWPAQMLADQTNSPSVRLARVHDRGMRQLEAEARKAALERKLGL